MTRQLVLIPGAGQDAAAREAPRRVTSWQLDERTRRIGLEGVAAAREALRAAAERVAADHPAA